MTFTARVSFVLLWLASLVLVGVFASAQTRREPGAIISGADIGFRPDGWNGKRRTGTWLVRIDGHSLMRNRLWAPGFGLWALGFGLEAVFCRSSDQEIQSMRDRKP